MLIAWHPLEKIFDGDSLPLADVAGVCQDQRGSTEDIALEKKKKETLIHYVETGLPLTDLPRVPRGL